MIQKYLYNGIHNHIMGVFCKMVWRTVAMGYLLGLCAFALFFLSDLNDWRLRRRALKVFFQKILLFLFVSHAAREKSVTLPPETR